MNMALTVIGAIMLIIGIAFTFITLGFAIFCVWPLLLIGFILLILGLALPSSDSKNVIHTPVQQPVVQSNRYCPGCGRNIPFDANICPYCGKNFRDNK